MIKPDAVAAGQAGEILATIQAAGFQFLGLVDAPDGESGRIETQKDRPARAAGQSSRFIAQGLRSGTSPKKWADLRTAERHWGRNQKPSSTDEVCRRVSISRFLRSQLRRIGLGHPPGRDPWRTVEEENRYAGER